MPIYEYVCDKCGKLIDVLQKISDPPPARCESCGAEGPLTKCVSKTSFVLKGGGWYSDLYGSSKKDTTAKDAGAKGKPAEDKPASSSPASPASTPPTSGAAAAPSGSTSPSGGSSETK
jgi:putative FmdB family regulatory protein